MIANIVTKIKNAPKDSGVYIFYSGKEVLYIGKASNLKNRLQSYLKITDFKTEALHREANNLKIFKLSSNIEALITESQLIKNLKPIYNVLWRDDKNYFYVAITKDKFPRIFLSHQLNEYPGANYIGPFTEGRAIKVILRLLRKFFPYCTHNQHLRLCLDAQINNCPGYCCQKNNQQPTTNNLHLIKKYNKNIRKIKNILTGKNKNFIHQLKDPYELLVLEKIWAHEPYLEGGGLRVKGLEDKNSKEKNLYPNPYPLNPNKVECYDNSHLSGKEAVGAMTAWVRQKNEKTEEQKNKWEAEKNMWRKFKIKGSYTEDDPRMMEEVVSRRLNHPEWPYPDLIIIDGGITQFNAAKKAIQRSNVKGQASNVIKVISFAKPQQLIFGLEKNPIPITKLPEEFQKLIGMAIQNTHNFAIRYHRKIRSRNML
ncbi:MAG: GIY-YIG nuclease family protein [Candidatus Harrisonbacteria bacterium]|nr:GIY-YIG nuclease family protein [Candidatus Harrisonbacteria bacterium]